MPNSLIFKQFEYQTMKQDVTGMGKETGKKRKGERKC